MLVRFIAHAGIYVEEDGFSILLDPWFLDSTIDRPVIESIGGGFKTIDFQIPRTTESIEQYAPDAIFISHFHPHHSPARDIRILCENSISRGKKIAVFYPTPDGAMIENIDAKIHGNAEKVPVDVGQKFSVGNFTIEAKDHTVPYHRAWYVTSPSGSLLHIADGRLNKNQQIRVVDDAWLNLRDLSPSLMFLSSGGHQLRTVQNGEHVILHAGIFTAAEAAEVTKIVAPKTVALIGIYNHSIWKNRDEYIQPAPLAIDEFHWAVSWLAAKTKHVRPLPGMTFGVGNPELMKTCDYYVSEVS